MPDPAVLRGMSVPVIALDGFLGADAPTAGSTSAPVALMATRHLLELGHRTVGHVAGPADWPQADGRHAGWLEALTEAGRSSPAAGAGRRLVARAGYQAGRRMLDEDPSTTAVFVANDQMALGADARLRRGGPAGARRRRVVGFDDIPEASFFSRR